MKIEFDDWDTSYEGSGFIVDMECVPRVGETVCIEQSLVHPRLFKSPYDEHPFPIIDGYVEMEVAVVEHRVSAAEHHGNHLVRICIA